MTYLFTQTPEFFSELCEEIRLFVDIRKIGKRETDEFDNEGFFVLHYFLEKKDKAVSTAKIVVNGKIVAQNTYECLLEYGKLAKKRTQKRAAKSSLYRALSEYFKKTMPWGCLTGIRPTKLLRDSQARYGDKEARKLFLDELDVSQSKLEFTQKNCRRSARVIAKRRKKHRYLYWHTVLCNQMRILFFCI